MEGLLALNLFMRQSRQSMGLLANNRFAVSQSASAACRTLLDEGDQRDLAPGIPLASSPATRTPLSDRLLAARRGDLAPGVPITPAPSSQIGTASGDLDLAPGAPITPAPSQALSSRAPSRAGSMPPAPPPTPAEVCAHRHISSRRPQQILAVHTKLRNQP